MEDYRRILLDHETKALIIYDEGLLEVCNDLGHLLEQSEGVFHASVEGILNLIFECVEVEICLIHCSLLLLRIKYVLLRYHEVH